LESNVTAVKNGPRTFETVVARISHGVVVDRECNDGFAVSLAREPVVVARAAEVAVAQASM
jgi:hypothetical protein